MFSWYLADFRASGELRRCSRELGVLRTLGGTANLPSYHDIAYESTHSFSHPMLRNENHSCSFCRNNSLSFMPRDAPKPLDFVTPRPIAAGWRANASTYRNIPIG